MIVKNGAATLARCLSSVRGVVDRIVVGDTGSTDDSIAVAKSFGAEVVPVSWQNDFAEARNAVLARASCDWVLVLDADEMLDLDGAAGLRSAVQTPEVAAYEVWRWNYVSDTSSRSGEQGALRNPGALKEASEYPAYVLSLNTRLFRRHPEVYFERPVHETVAHRLQVLGMPVMTAPFVIHHLGQAEDALEERKRKNELYHRIGLEHLKNSPEDARTCFELGLGELEHYHRPDRALRFFLKVLQLSHRDSNALLFAGICLNRLGRFPEALEMLTRSAMIHPGSVVLQEAIGDAYFHQGLYGEACEAYRTAQDLGGSSALVLAKRGACEVHLGRSGVGMHCMRKALELEEGFPELLDVVAAGAALAKEYRFAAKVAERRLGLPAASGFHRELATALLRLAEQQETVRETGT